MQTLQHLTIIENPNPREPLTEGEKYLINMLSKIERFNGWTLFVQPFINSMHPDFILTHREKGVIIIEVKDWHLKPPTYLAPAKVLGTNNKYHFSNPVTQVNAYKEMILKYELTNFLSANEHYHKNSFGMISTIVYFHKASRSEGLAFCNYPTPNNCYIWDRNVVEDFYHFNERNDELYPPYLFYPQSNFAKGNGQYLQQLVDELHSLLRQSDYVRERRTPIKLTSEQQALVSIKIGRPRRWSGVAGSGKTLIIAEKASEAIKQGLNVLIITFNITLRHYIRDLCSQQFGLENRHLLKSHLTISHFHGFLKTVMNETSCSVQNVYDNIEDYTDTCIDMISKKLAEHHPYYLKYDCIFIDEGQDFNGPWIMFLKNFHTNNGELLIMYDKEQSIYEDRGVWITDPNQNTGIGFSGRAGSLNISHRLPESIVHQVQRLSNVFGNTTNIVAKSTQPDLFTQIEWIDAQPFINRADLCQHKVQEILNLKISTIEDITIITMREDTGIEIVNAFKQHTSISHVYDMVGTRDHNRRRNEKWRFQPGKNKLKICSYHSFKGWESSHIILLLEGLGNEQQKIEEMKKALFIALTRVKSFSDSRSFTCINNCEELNFLSSYF
ncbi:nuclease-related domain-containing DEAD/DEAH box helicase [Solibacillus sp. FSL K6-4121]|uniref:nuclease-related domain-containing DEAD/DEAH box helicase n=1 Tax=Solibacillus sp. FSL K6-4121 TaxID=2921505 RepID=UPI0030F79206